MPVRPFSVPALLCVLLLLLAAPAAAAQEQEPSITISVDGGPFTVGDPIRVRVEVQYPQGASVTPPALDAAVRPFEVVEAPQESRGAAADGREALTYQFTVTAFQTGPLTLPPLPFTYQQPGAAPRTIATPPTAVVIESVLPPDQPSELRDLKPQAELPAPPSQALARGAAAALAAVVLALGFLVLRRALRRPKPAAWPAVPQSPEDAAAAELDRIGALNLIERREFQTFYRLVADCIRRYLTDRYGFPAVALTTTELRADMEAHGLTPWQARLVDSLLTECDDVVYAGYVPAPGRAAGDLAVAYEIVEMTRPREELVQEAV